MKTETVSRTVYVALDGRRFNDKSECADYEAALNRARRIENVDKYANLDDDTIVSNAYKDLLDVIIKKPHKGSYYYYWAKENGDVIGIAFSITISGSDPVTMPIIWSGDYSRLNDNATNKTLSNAFSSAYGTSE